MNIKSQVHSFLKKGIPHIIDSRSIGMHNFYSPGKLMLTGEYFVLDGAKAIAIPTMLGQSLKIESKKTFSEPTLKWKGLDYQDQVWLEVVFSLRDFSIISSTDENLALRLKNIFQEVRNLNIHFLREEKEFTATSKIEFPMNWGLGSSSTLIFNISQWAYVSPFELSKNTFGGSGCDIAVAEAKGPVIFQKYEKTQEWKLCNLSKLCLSNLYFVHLDKKQNTQDELKFYYKSHDEFTFSKVAKQITQISEELLKVEEVSDFNKLINEHESIVSKTLNKIKVKDQYFNDFDGSIKSLGAWGGDFVLVSSENDFSYVSKYFNDLGLSTIFKFNDLVSDFNLLS